MDNVQYSIETALVTSLEQLRGIGLLNDRAKPLQGRSMEITEGIVDTILANVDAYSDTANPKILPLLNQHIAALVAEYLRLLAFDETHNLGFVEHYARDAANHYFPLEALLHAYRVTMQWLLEITTSTLSLSNQQDGVPTIIAITRFLLEYINVVSTLASEHYLDQSRLLADVASDQRSALLAILLGGFDESDRRVSTILRDAGYLDKRIRFCVVLAQTIDPTEMHNPTRARRLVEYIDGLLAHLPGKQLVDIHRNKVTIVFSHQHRLSGWSVPDPPLAARMAKALLMVGPAARLGISNDVDSTAQIPSAYRQASLAFNASSIGQRVVQFSEIPVQKLLLHFAHEEFSRVLPQWSNGFREADERSLGNLSATLRAYAENNMNLLKTARQLGIHANTVYARFDRIIALTGRDARGFEELNELLIVTTING